MRRKATTKAAKNSVKDFKQIKNNYLLDTEVVVAMDGIPVELIVNFDQTGIHYVPVSDWTMAEEGAKWVELVGKDDKSQLTAVFAFFRRSFCHHIQFTRENNTLPSTL